MLPEVHNLPICPTKKPGAKDSDSLDQTSRLGKLGMKMGYQWAFNMLDVQWGFLWEFSREFH